MTLLTPSVFMRLLCHLLVFLYEARAETYKEVKAEEAVCNDADTLLTSVFKSSTNVQRLRKAFDHTNHRPPPYVLVTYAVGVSRFPAAVPCGEAFGGAFKPGDSALNPATNYSLERWIWTTSLMHLVINPFTLVEFGLFTPWISWEYAFPGQSFSWFSDHGNVCLVVPCRMSGAIPSNLAVLTTKLRSALYTREITDNTIVAIDADASYAVGTQSFMGIESSRFNVTFRFFSAIASLIAIVTVMALYCIYLALAKHATAFTAYIHNFPEMLFIVWGAVLMASALNIILTIKMVLVAFAYIQHGSLLYIILSVASLIGLALLIVGAAFTAKTVLPPYKTMPTLSSHELLLKLATCGIMGRRRIKWMLQFFFLLEICYFVPVLSGHLVISSLAFVTDPVQNGLTLLFLLATALTIVCLLAAIVSLDHLFGITPSNFVAIFLPALMSFVKLTYIGFLFATAGFFLGVIIGLECLNIRSDFYRHYRVSQFLSYYLSPIGFAFATLITRYILYYFQMYFDNGLQF